MKQKPFKLKLHEYELFDEADQPLLVARRTTVNQDVSWAWALAIAAVLVLVLGSAVIMTWVEPRILERFPGVYVSVLLIAGAIAAVVATAALVTHLPARHVKFTSHKTGLLAMTLLQDERVQWLRQSFTLVLPGGPPIAVLRKNLLSDLVRSEWEVYAPDGERLLFRVVESSYVGAFARRMLGVFRQQFVFTDATRRAVLGTFRRDWTVWDYYSLDLTADEAQQIDRRTAVAVAVMLDAAQRR